MTWAPSDRGELTLLQLTDEQTGRPVHQIRLDGELLVSSEAEECGQAMVRNALNALDGHDWDIALGGLGLGIAACTVLEEPRVRSLLILEREEALVAWCRARLLPTADRILADPRARIECADLLLAVAADRLDPHGVAGRRVDALLVNVDAVEPGPEASNSYGRLPCQVDLWRVLRPGGVLAVWAPGTDWPGRHGQE